MADSKFLSFYVWKGMDLVKNPKRILQLPAVTGRLLLSFTALELRSFSQRKGAKLISSFISKANARSIRVELLLGEPSWVMDIYRPRLFELLDYVREIPFDGFHFDIERSQLPAYEQTTWSEGIVRVAAEMNQWLDTKFRARVPIGFSVHHRDLADSVFVDGFRNNGNPEIVAMVYVANPISAQHTMLTAQLRSGSYPNLSIAVSIEESLSSEESTFKRGRIESLEQWNDLHSRLQCPIIVQSFEDYMKAEV